MAVITPSFSSEKRLHGGAINRWSGTGADNSADTLTSVVVPAGQVQRIVYVAAQYDDTATYTGTALTVKIDSSLGALFDVVLSTGTDNEESFVYSPDEEVYLLPGDAVAVAVPAGGSGVGASVVIVTEIV